MGCKTDGHFLAMGRCPSTIYSNNYSGSIRFMQFSIRERFFVYLEGGAANSFMVEMIKKTVRDTFCVRTVSPI